MYFLSAVCVLETLETLRQQTSKALPILCWAVHKYMDFQSAKTHGPYPKTAGMWSIMLDFRGPDNPLPCRQEPTLCSTWPRCPPKRHRCCPSRGSPGLGSRGRSLARAVQVPKSTLGFHKSYTTVGIMDRWAIVRMALGLCIIYGLYHGPY